MSLFGEHSAGWFALGLLGALVDRSRRRKQGVKNALVLAGPFTAGRIADSGVLLSALIACVAFSLAASAVYLVNDAIDVESDRAHPKKRFRPIAAGIVPVPAAYVA